MSKYKPVAIPELGITGEEPNWGDALITAFKHAHPEHTKKLLGFSKRSGKINIFTVVRFTRAGRHKVGQYRVGERRKP